MATLWVGATEPYKTLSAAVSAAASGDTIHVRAGTYTNDFVNIRKDLSIIGVDGKAHFVATVPPSNGKAIFVTSGAITLENIELSGASVRDGNGAGIRYEGGSLTIRNCSFHHNENGILGASDPTGRISISGSQFSFNGKGDGYTHNLYVNRIASLTVEDSLFHNVNAGHHVKSRAAETTVVNSLLVDGTASSSYSIDLPNGGKGVIKGNYIEQGLNASNRTMVSFGAEGSLHGQSSLTVDGNGFVNKASSAIGVKNFAGSVVAVVTNNGFADVGKWTEGLASASGNRVGVDAAGFDTAPQAHGDYAVARYGVSVTVNVLANDRDFDGDRIALSGVTQGQNGSVKTNADGTVTYTPKNGFSGTDRFTYTIRDEDGRTDSATVDVRVAAQGEAPGGTVRVRVSGDAFDGDPQFKLLLDGKQVGSVTTVTASHTKGEWQEFTFRTPDVIWAKKLGLSFANDAWGGSGDKDRDLWVDWIEVNGARSVRFDPEILTPSSRAVQKTATAVEMTQNGTIEFDVPMIGMDPGSATMY